MKNGKSHTHFQRYKSCSYKNRVLNVKLWWVGGCERKNRVFFVALGLS